MDRRAFILGTVKAAAAGALIIEATDGDVAQFATKTPVTVKPMPWITSGGRLGEDTLLGCGVQVGQPLFDEHGKRVGFVREVKMHRPMLDVTTAQDSFTRYVSSPGPLDIEIALHYAPED